MINEYGVCGPRVCTGVIPHLERLPPLSTGDAARGVQLHVSLGLPDDITLNTQILWSVRSDVTSVFPLTSFKCIPFFSRTRGAKINLKCMENVCHHYS